MTSCNIGYLSFLRSTKWVSARQLCLLLSHWGGWCVRWWRCEEEGVVYWPVWAKNWCSHLKDAEEELLVWTRWLHGDAEVRARSVSMAEVIVDQMALVRGSRPKWLDEAPAAHSTRTEVIPSASIEWWIALLSQSGFQCCRGFVKVVLSLGTDEEKAMQFSQPLFYFTKVETSTIFTIWLEMWQFIHNAQPVGSGSKVAMVIYKLPSISS